MCFHWNEVSNIVSSIYGENSWGFGVVLSISSSSYSGWFIHSKHMLWAFECPSRYPRFCAPLRKVVRYLVVEVQYSILLYHWKTHRSFLVLLACGKRTELSNYWCSHPRIWVCPVPKCYWICILNSQSFFRFNMFFILSPSIERGLLPKLDISVLRKFFG